VDRLNRRPWLTEDLRGLRVWAGRCYEDDVFAALPASAADAISLRLALPRLALREAADACASRPWLGRRGQVVIGVLGQFGVDACLLDRCWRPGSTRGRWGTVTRWDAASHDAPARCPRAWSPAE
jgi:hypothetical protein